MCSNLKRQSRLSLLHEGNDESAPQLRYNVCIRVYYLKAKRTWAILVVFTPKCSRFNMEDNPRRLEERSM